MDLIRFLLLKISVHICVEEPRRTRRQLCGQIPHLSKPDCVRHVRGLPPRHGQLPQLCQRLLSGEGPGGVLGNEDI